MANRVAVMNETCLEDLIEEYGSKNTQLKGLKEEVDKSNGLIKSLMKEGNMTEAQTENWVATYSVQHRESVDEDKLLELLKKEWTARNGSMQCPYIKLKEYVDFDVLEDMIYNNKVTSDALACIDNCRNTKEIEVLKVTHRK